MQFLKLLMVKSPALVLQLSTDPEAKSGSGEQAVKESTKAVALKRELVVNVSGPDSLM